MKKIACGLLLAAVALTQTGCDYGLTSVFDGLLGSYGMDFGSLAGGGFYDDGSWGNWLTDSYVSSDGMGNTAIWLDGASCYNGECY